MNKKKAISEHKKLLKLKLVTEGKEDVRLRLVKTAEELATTAKERESVRKKLVVTAEELSLKAKELAETAKDKESIRQKLVVTAEELATTAKERESVRKKLVVTAKEKESTKQKLAVTAGELKESHALLEQKVRDRTKDLEDANMAILNILEDLNAEKKVSTERLYDLKKFQLAVESTADQIIISDTEGIVIFANKAMETITGYSINEVIGTNVGKLWGSQMGQNFYKEVWHAIKIDKKPFIQQIKNRRKNGELYTAEIHISPIVDEKGVAIYFVAIERDITKEKELEKLKDEFVSVASHELRTPLTAIDGLVSMMLDGEYGEVNNELKQPLSDVNTSSERLIHLVNDLLNLSRIQAGRLKYTLSEFDIKPVIAEVVELLQPIAKPRGLLISSSSINSLNVSADSDKIKQILNNIIGNSLKFTDKGSIIVSTKTDKDKIIVFITDTGIGIAKEDQTKLFGKFQQLTSSQGRPPGTGLGLHISKEMACKMGGDMWIEKSEPGKGSSFAFSIPIAKSSRAEKVKKEIETEAKEKPEQKSDTITKT